jgi:predicted DNA-binding transcriptional regulator AlpA
MPTNIRQQQPPHEIRSAAPRIDTATNEIMTVADVAALLKCKSSSIYNMTRRRGRVRYDHPIPVLRLPCGLRFKRSSVLAWLDSLETPKTQ